jgi:NAD(P)-dependent dehydrogenase (short-subunit alcohol dehydrogenase family)
MTPTDPTTPPFAPEGRGATAEPAGQVLAGKRALVTGAGTGIGREIALEFGRQGADVVVHYSRSAKGAESAVAEIQALGRRAVALQTDLSQAAHCFELIDRAAEFLGGLDILMNNAGITIAGPFLDARPEDFDQLYHVNVRGQFFCAQGAARHMLRAGEQRGGSGRGCKGVIINMSSIHGSAGFVDHTIYDGTKGAIIAMTRTMAIELAPLGIRVNGITPGWIVVESHYRQICNFDPDDIGRRMVPWRRLGRPIEVARACVYIASDDADYMVGHILTLDGGVLAKVSMPIDTLDSEWADIVVD